MNQYEFILGIVIVVMIASVIKAGIRGDGHSRRRRRREALPAAAEAEVDDEPRRLREEVRTLKERIAVLERIATDKSARLEREIEELRDR